MLLSIPKKAVTEADAQFILEQAYSLTRPFGVPTLILNTNHLQVRDDLNQEPPSQVRMPNMVFLYGPDRRQLGDIFYDVLEECPELSKDDALGLAVALNMSSAASIAIKDVPMGRFSAYSHRIPKGQYNKFAHHYTESSYESPAFNTIYISQESFSAEEWLASILKANKDEIAACLPGYNSQYHFMLLVHEMGHGTGAGEAQTDMMAAIACRQAFADTRFISAYTDLRTLSLFYNMAARREQGYHWSMVEGLDHVIAMDQSAIDVMCEDDIKALRFKPFPHVEEQWNSIQAIFGAASAHGGTNFSEAYEKRDLSAIARTIRDLSTTHLSEDAQIIAARLALAAERLGIPDAYETSQPLPGPR